MAEAHKCDVINCNEMAEGAPAGRFFAEALGVGKVLCQKHTDEVVTNYFPDLLKKEEPAQPETPAAPAADVISNLEPGSGESQPTA